MSNTMHSGIKYTEAPPEIGAAIRASVVIPDEFPSPDELRRELKRSITIRLDPDVYEWFKLPGAGYQTRINAVLRAYMTSQQKGKIGSGYFLQAVKSAPASGYYIVAKKHLAVTGKIKKLVAKKASRVVGKMTTTSKGKAKGKTTRRSAKA